MNKKWLICLNITVIIAGVFFSAYCKDMSKRKGGKKQSESSDIKMTFLDTLNNGKELYLTDDDIVSISQPQQKTAPEGKIVVPDGYRIQLMASSSEETVRIKKKSIEKELRVDVYIVFDKPYYKVYVGNYTTRRAAERMLKKVKQSGYSDAWIVKSKVFIDE